MPDRDMALAYAAAESGNWAATAQHCAAALAGGAALARQLLAVARYSQGEFEAALELLETALAAGELTADGAARLIRLRLLLGRPRAAWELLAECCRNHVFGPPLYGLPHWRGEPLAGAHVVVWGGGLGDEMFYARYLPRLCDMAATVSFNCRPPLLELFRTLHPRLQLLPLDVAPGAADLQMCSAELPLHCGAADGWPEPAAAAAYLHAAPAPLPPGGLRVGVVWAADSRHLEADDRTAALADMACLAQVPGIRLFNLQVGRTAAQADPAPAGMRIAPLSLGFPSFAEQAAQIRGLDLVVSVDTAVANLAGALGAPLWVAVPHIPDWRWERAGTRTRWYPSARVYRQPTRGNWRDVFQAMARDLAARRLD